MRQRISVFILSSLLAFVSLSAQESRKAIKNVVKTPEPAFFEGMALSVEVGSPIAHLVGTDALSTEGGLRFNFMNKYFPIAELGYGKYDSTNKDTNIHYHTSAPYLRLGLDVNMLKDKLQENRMMVGFRVGYSNYKFDVDGPSITDPVWKDTQPLAYQGLSCNRLWLEVVAGLESEILRHFHMGFSIRYKFKLHEKAPSEANPYFIPGFGNTENGFRATYNIYFDLTKKAKNIQNEKK